MSELKNCPFCGNDVATQSFWYGCESLGKPRAYHVFCLECSETDSLDGPCRDTLEEAIAAWNTRAAAPVPPAGSDDDLIRRTINALNPSGGEIRVSVPAMRLTLEQALAARAQPPVGEVVNSAHAAYGALWCMVTDNPVIHAARNHLLAAIGGRGSDAQREAIKWAGRHVQPPSDAEIMAIDAHPAEPAARGLGSIVQRILSDYQTSETHHPDHVLIRREDFEVLAAQSAKGASA